MLLVIVLGMNNWLISVCYNSSRTHLLSQVPYITVLSGKALWVKEAVCEVTGSNDQTSAEESPQRGCKYKAAFSSLHVVP